MPRVVVLGGGPAGATLGALLAQRGVSVRVLERETHPRPHVGESLQPALVALLDHHLGLGPALAAAGFPRKYGAVYQWGERREPWSVLFDPRLDAELPGLDEAGLLAGGYEHAWNVERARFDTILWDAAGRAGAEREEGTEALGVVEEDGRVVGVRVARGGREETCAADFVVDATGQRCLLGRHFGLTRGVPDLRATATYAWFDGAGGLPGALGRHAQWIVTVPDGWIWFIPISADRTSVGVVSRERARMDEARFDTILAGSGLPLAGARRGPQQFARDWSFSHERVHGPGWALVGDAAAFVDPILSGGVDFAVRGACQLALALLRSWEGDREALAGYARDLAADYAAYLRLARYWYGNNRSVDGLFWEAHRALPPGSLSTPYRAFVYLTSGRLAADRHLRVFQEWQEAKMFRALGVDAAAVVEAVRRRGRPG